MWWTKVTWIFMFTAYVLGMPKPPGGTRDTRAAPMRLGLIDAAKYLSKYGYVSQSKTSRTLAAIADLNPSTLASPIRDFQRFAGIEETGNLDSETMRYMTMPRCGVDDTTGMSSMGSKGYNTRGKYQKKNGKGRHKKKKHKGGKGKSRQKRYDLHGSEWKKKDLTYAISNYTPDMKRHQVRSAMKKALKLWADKSELTFKEISDVSKADLKISFGNRYHGDVYPFDGSGGTLAHAFFPQNGEAHFDDDETFSDKGQGTNLLIVAAHEFGHSLGLSHSTVQDSLMAPFYQGYVPDFELHPDDIAAIQALYGKKVDTEVQRPTRPRERPTTRPRTAKPTKKPRTNLPNPCSTNVDATISYTNHSRQVTYIFKGSYYYKIDDHGVVAGYPKKIGKRWENLPGNIDGAAHSDRTGYTYFFKGDKVYSYEGTRLRRGFPTTRMELPSSLRAALAWGDNGMLYLFKKKNFYLYDDVRQKVYGSRHISSVWKGVPEDIDTAFTWARNRRTYFVKGNRFWRFNSRLGTVDEGYPQNFNEMWLGCSKGVASSLRDESRNNRRPSRRKLRKRP